MLLEKATIKWIKPLETKNWNGVDYTQRSLMIRFSDGLKKDTQLFVVDKTKNLDNMIGEHRNIDIEIINIDFKIEKFKKRDGTFGEIYSIRKYEMGNYTQQAPSMEYYNQIKPVEQVKDSVDWLEEMEIKE